MTAPFDITRALSDQRLLGAGLGVDQASWSTWRTVLKAAFALPLDEAEREVFGKIGGGRSPPTRRVRELWVTAGRRSGKSRMAAAVGLHLGLFQQHKLAAGEAGHVAIMAASIDQARNLFGYVEGFVEASSALKREVSGHRNTANMGAEIRFRNGIVVGVHPASFRTIRGRTIVGAVFDETSFWRDEGSASPDIETYRAVLPALVASGGMLVSISSPYRRAGLQHAKHRDHFGVEGDDVLAVQADTAMLNPLIDKREVEAAYAADPEAAPSEWGGEFRSDIASYLDDLTIDAAVDRDRPLEIPYRKQHRYCAFVDASAGRSDSFGYCVGHKEGERFVADVVGGITPPFDPASAVTQIAALVKSYKIGSVTGDHYAGEWTVAAFKAHGLRYLPADAAKSVLYLEALPLFTRNLISIPDHPRLLRELRLLERRTHRSGKDVVDHGRSGHDDLANVLAGCAVRAETASKLATYASMAWVDDEVIDQGERPGTWRDPKSGVLYGRIETRPLSDHPFF